MGLPRPAFPTFVLGEGLVGLTGFRKLKRSLLASRLSLEVEVDELHGFVTGLPQVGLSFSFLGSSRVLPYTWYGSVWSILCLTGSDVPGSVKNLALSDWQWPKLRGLLCVLVCLTLRFLSKHLRPSTLGKASGRQRKCGVCSRPPVRWGQVMVLLRPK